MKFTFLQTGDLHIGRQFHFKYNGDTLGKQRRQDIWAAFDKTIKIVQDNDIDLLLVTGDLFDAGEMNVAEIKRAADRFASLTHTWVVITAGKNDKYSPITHYGLVDWPPNVVVFQSGALESVYFPELNAEIYGMSWKRDHYSSIPFNQEVQLDHEHTNILMLYGDAFSTSDENLPINIRDFEAFDYIALGSSHNHTVLTEKAAYAGSPEPLGFEEEGEHGVIIGKQVKDRIITQFFPIQKRRYFNHTLVLNPEVNRQEIKRQMIHVDDVENRMEEFYRFIFKGDWNPQMGFSYLEREMKDHFYYVELEFGDLDLHLDKLLHENRKNMIGQIISELQKNESDPVNRKALLFTLEGMLKEKVIR